MRRFLTDCFNEHLKTSTAHPLCGRLIMVDGHAKVVRSHCSCPILAGGTSMGLTADLSRYCRRTPERGRALCKVCLYDGAVFV